VSGGLSAVSGSIGAALAAVRGARADAALALAAAALLALSALTVAAVPTAADATGSEVSYDASVPDEFDFGSGTEADGVARVNGERFDALAPALDAAEAGDTVAVSGRFDPESAVAVETPNVTLEGVGDRLPVVDGSGEGDVLVVNATGVTVERLWVRNSGYATADNDAAVWVDGARSTVRHLRVTNTTFGVWVDGVANVTVANTTIVGRDEITARSDRGNGIQLWEATGARVVNNRITDARDGVYYSWASDVVARNNTLWDLRYGVHYMYSDRCVLANNTAVDNDAGYALMISQDLRIVDNVAVNNTGQSGHGIMLKSIDRTTVRGNHFVGNGNGVFFYNSLDNEVSHNLVAGNDVGVHLSAGSVRERIYRNTFVRNAVPVRADVGGQVTWNESVGNYWGGAGVRDVDDDGVAESAYRPTDLVQRLRAENEQVGLFAASPAVSVVRLAERTLPVVESSGVVDRRPLVDPEHDWRRYYDRG
jgi:nitrous oxidase accessory protein